jgi:hypothetical protein
LTPAPTAYLLGGGSPALGAGVNLQSAYSINPGGQDYYGQAIPYPGGGYNIGAAPAYSLAIKGLSAPFIAGVGRMMLRQ